MIESFPGKLPYFYLTMHQAIGNTHPPDGLNANNMNVYPGGKQPLMRDTEFNGVVQKMVLPDGTPKGMKMVLQERG